MKLFYTINRSSGYRPYEHIHIHVYRSPVKEDYESAKRLFELEWQGSPEHAQWYGGSLEMKQDDISGIECAIKAASTFVRLMQKAKVYFREDPAAVAAALEGAGIRRLVYDGRLDEYLEPEKVKGKEYWRYMAWVDGSCCCSAIARDDEDAVGELMRRFAEYIAEGGGCYNYARRLEQWIAEGKRVKIDDHARVGDERPLAEILKPMKEPEPAPKEEQKEEVVA